MVAGQVSVEVNDDAALIVLRHRAEQLRTVSLLVARGQAPPINQSTIIDNGQSIINNNSLVED